MVSNLGGFPRINCSSEAPLAARRLVFIGTCQVMPLSHTAMKCGMVADHVLCASYADSNIPAVDDGYDAAVISLTLRHINMDAAVRMEPRRPIYNCMYWPRTVHDKTEDEYFYNCAALVRSKIDQFCAGIKGVKFFAAFIEPRHNYLGNMMPRYHLSNPKYFVERLNQVMAEAISRHAGAYFLDMNELIAMKGNLQVQDDYIGNIAHSTFLLYTDEAESAPRIQKSVPPTEMWESEPIIEEVTRLAIQRISENLAVIERPLQTKLIIVDLDDTLWRGIAAEENDHELGFTEGWPLGIAEALLIYKARGGMLAICSKNDLDATRKRFVEIFHGRLRLTDFAAIRINYERKSENIRSILDEVNILPANAWFIDDNPREIDEVRQVFPEMRFLSAEHYDWRRQILMSPETQVSVITEEAALRTKSVQAQATRAQPAAVGRDEWLASLGMTLRIEQIGVSSHPRFDRALELINKTNQFNTTGERWSREALAELLASGGALLCGTLRDRVAEYGLVCVVVMRGSEIVQIVLSCRAFGNNVEHALVRAAMEQMLADHASVAATIIDTGRNKTCHRFFTELGWADMGEGRFVGRELPPPVAHIAMAA